jgi:crotonobetainyl-CoA:carnitine CoA-transferase CaiB-like acyl-CoA transferase
MLEGVTVIEAAGVITGPFAAMMLADLGADVIKVEPPHGDQFRQWDANQGGLQTSFICFNRGKRSVALDLKSEEGKEIYQRLVAEADVIIENFRPGTMDRLGLGYESVSRMNPDIIYCHISGQGSEGTVAKSPTYDSIAQALSGLWSQFIEHDEPEAIGPTLADQLTAMYATMAVLGALQARLTMGGQFVEVNMVASCLAFQGQAIAKYTHEGEVTDRLLRAKLSQAYAFVDSDAQPFTVHLSSPQKFWEGLCKAIGDSGLATNPAFDTKRKRIDRYHELHARLQNVFVTRSREHWIELLAEAGVPVAPILDIGEALARPAVIDSGIVSDISDGRGLGGLVKSPVRVGGHHLSASRPAPRLAQHSREVLGALGYAEEQIRELANSERIRVEE